jgi:hypothetical protein
MRLTSSQPGPRSLVGTATRPEVVLIGYRGADIDMRAVIDQARGDADSIRWFMHTRDNWDDMMSCRRFSSVGRMRQESTGIMNPPLTRKAD